MTEVVARRATVKFGIPEVLIVLEARDVVGGQVATLRRLALAEGVVHVPGIAIREPLPNGCLQAVVFHRLAAVDVVAAWSAESRIRPQTCHAIKSLRKMPL